MAIDENMTIDNHSSLGDAEMIKIQGDMHGSAENPLSDPKASPKVSIPDILTKPQEKRKMHNNSVMTANSRPMASLR